MSRRSTKQINEQKHKLEDLLLDLLELTAEELMDRMRTGEASPQDISNAIKLCKENGIDIRITDGEPLDILDKTDLPFQGENVVKMKHAK